MWAEGRGLLLLVGSLGPGSFCARGRQGGGGLSRQRLDLCSLSLPSAWAGEARGCWAGGWALDSLSKCLAVPACPSTGLGGRGGERQSPPEPVLQARAEGRCLLRNPRPGGLSDPLSSSAATPTSLPAWLRWRQRDRAWLEPWVIALTLAQATPCPHVGSQVMPHGPSLLSACNSSLFWPCCPAAPWAPSIPGIWLRSGRQRGSGAPGPLSVPSVHLSPPDLLFLASLWVPISVPISAWAPKDPLIHLAFSQEDLSQSLPHLHIHPAAISWADWARVPRSGNMPEGSSVMSGWVAG